MEEKVSYYFDHEKLRVYQKSIEFIGWIDNLLSTNLVKGSTADQILRASESIVLNIAEGNGKFTSKDRCRYFDISRGSAMECAGCLDVFFAKKKINSVELHCHRITISSVETYKFTASAVTICWTSLFPTQKNREFFLCCWILLEILVRFDTFESCVLQIIHHVIKPHCPLVLPILNYISGVCVYHDTVLVPISILQGFVCQDEPAVLFIPVP